MKRKRLTGERIITIPRENEAGMRLQVLVRNYDVSRLSVNRWILCRIN